MAKSQNQNIRPRIAEIEAHKVRTGESIDSLAKGVGMRWQDLAKFNWNTDVPVEINKALREVVGCTRKTADGYNYMFDDSDDPGIVYIPRPWSIEQLATGRIHTIYVSKIVPQDMIELILPVEMDSENDPHPDDEIRLRSEDGSFERSVSLSDPVRVERDAKLRLLFCNFGRIPRKRYSISLKVVATWADILHGLEVGPRGLRLDGKDFSSDLDDLHLGCPDDGEDGAPPPPSPPGDAGGDYLDQDEALFPREDAV
jgi:hypothetical protein